MYMRNNRSKHTNYNIGDFPPNYSGQYTIESLQMNADDDIVDIDTAGKDVSNTAEESDIHSRNRASSKTETENNQNNQNNQNDKAEKSEKEEKKNASFLSTLFGGNKDKDKDGKKGGLLSGLFGKDAGDKDGGIGGFLAGIELEDLILLAVIFFLLKDGFEDDLIIILAIILLSQ